MELATTALDPIRAAVKNEIPAHLRLELQDAEHAKQHAMEIKNMAAMRFGDAEEVLRKFWESNGPQLSERGWKKHAELKTAMETAEADFQAAHSVLAFMGRIRIDRITIVFACVTVSNFPKHREKLDRMLFVPPFSIARFSYLGEKHHKQPDSLQCVEELSQPAVFVSRQRTGHKSSVALAH